MLRTLIVLVLLAALGGYVWFVELKGKEATESAEKEAARVFTARRDEIRAIVLSGADGEIEIVREGETWRLARPVSDTAEQPAVTGLLSQIEGSSSIETIDDVTDFAPFGLDPAAAVVRVRTAQGEEIVRIGKRSPVGGKTYVRRGDEPRVLQVSGGIESITGRPAGDYRNKQMFRFAASEVTAVTIRRAGQPELVVRRNGEDWRLTAPVSMDADDGVAGGIARDLAALRIAGWQVEMPTAGDLAKAGLVQPEARLEVELANGTRHEIAFGSQHGQDRFTRAAGRPAILRVADWNYQQLAKDPDALRDRRLFPHASDRVSRLEFYDGRSLTAALERHGAEWRLAGSASGATDADKVIALLAALEAYRANEWKAVSRAERRDLQLEAPARRLVAYGADGKKLAELAFGRAEGEWAVWVQTDAPGAAAKAPTEFLQSHWPANGESFASAPEPAPSTDP